MAPATLKRPQPRIRPITRKRIEPAESAPVGLLSKERPAALLVEELISSTAPAAEPIKIYDEERRHKRGRRSVTRQLGETEANDVVESASESAVPNPDLQLENFSSDIKLDNEGNVVEIKEDVVEDKSGLTPTNGDKTDYTLVADWQDEKTTEEKVATTQSIAELVGVLQAEKTVHDKYRSHPAEEVVGYIREAEDYLDKNLADIVSAVMSGKSNGALENLRARVDRITTGGSLGIRQQVRVLFRKKMEDHFHEHRSTLVVENIRNTHSFADLTYLIKQFRSIKDGKQVISPTEALARIDRARQAAEHFVEGPDVLKAPLYTLESFVVTLLHEQHIPNDSEIDQTVHRLLLDYIRERRLTREAELAQNTWVAKAKQTMSRIFGWR